MSMFSALGLALAGLLVPCVSHGEAFACPAGGARDAVVTVETRLAGVPALLRVPPTITGPPVLLWHGFGPPASARALAQRSDAVKRADAITAGDPPPALRIVQGAADAMLTPEPALALQQALVPRYGAHAGQRLHLELVEGMPHNVTDADTIAGLRASVADWFNRFLDIADEQDGA